MGLNQEAKEKLALQCVIPLPFRTNIETMFPLSYTNLSGSCFEPWVWDPRPLIEHLSRMKTKVRSVNF